MRFEYFENPEHYSYLTSEPIPCSICKIIQICFDAEGFTGSGQIEAVCADCMKKGNLIELDCCPNEVGGNLANKLSSKFSIETHSNIIVYCTPSLPSWQEIEWPIKNGDFCKFIKIASRPDFRDKQELFNAIPEEYHFGRDANEFWEMLPEAAITNLKDGNYDTSFYLFTSGIEKIVLWDCN